MGDGCVHLYVNFGAVPGPNTKDALANTYVNFGIAPVPTPVMADVANLYVNFILYQFTGWGQAI